MNMFSEKVDRLFTSIAFAEAGEFESSRKFIIVDRNSLHESALCEA